MKKDMVCNNNVMLTLGAIVIIFLIVLGSMKMVSADEVAEYKKSFVTIEVCSGDTLTSIAQEHAISEADYEEYIEEVVQINHLKGDVIHSGCYLLIPVYDELMKN